MKLGDSILTYNNEKWTCESPQNQMPVEQKQSLVDLKKSMDLYFPYIKEESLKENKKKLYETLEIRLKN